MGSPLSQIGSGVAGGLAVAAIAALLVAVDVIDVGDGGGDQSAVQQPITRPGNSGGSGGKTVAQIYDDVAPGVGFITSEGVTTNENSPFGGPPQRGVASGSGFVLDDRGFMLTNAHVVEGAERVTVAFGEDDPVEAEVVGSDLSSDLAVLQVNPDEVELDPLPLGDSRDVAVGDPAIVVGNPFGFDRTVTTGIISALQRQITAPNGFSIPNVLQTDAAINPGNSGGPLLDADGRVIGINSQIISTGGGLGAEGGSVGIGFAVPIDTAKEIVPELEQNGKVERAFLGVTTAPVTAQVAEDFNLPTDSGALVQRVVSGGPADKAGLRAGRTQTAGGIVAGGDVIVKVDGETIDQPDDVAAAIDDNDPGESVEIEYYRGEELETADVELGERPQSVQDVAPSPGEQPPPGGNLPFP